MKIQNLVFMSSLMFGSIMTISSYSWMSMWMGLEINLMAMIPLMASSKNIFSNESSMKYFFTQVLASMILLTAILLVFLTEEFLTPLGNSPSKIMLMTALMMKMGAAPFHFWFPEVMEGLSWMNALIMLTWQKIAPMFIVMNIPLNPTFMVFLIISSLIFSITGVINQTSLRKILAFSSINHIAWLLSAMMISVSVWIIYFSVYVTLNWNIITLFKKTNSSHLSQLTNFLNSSKMNKFILMSNFLTLGGLPPTIGFFTKWLIIQELFPMNLLTTTLIITTLVMLLIYTRIFMTSLILNTIEPKTFKLPTSPSLSMSTLALTALPFCTLAQSFL